MLRYLIPALLIGGAAQAACPGPADLDADGIWVRVSDGTITHYQRNAAGNIEETSDYGEGSGYWIESYNGIYVMNEQSIAEGKREPGTEGSSTFPVPLEALPAAEPGTRWEGVVTYTDTDSTVQQRTTMIFGPEIPVRIGPCSYSAVSADYVVRPDNDEGYAGRILVTNLGISLFVANGIPDASYSEYYRIVEIANEPLE